MFSIEATNAKKWRWIAGVFKDRSAAEAFLQAIPDANRAMQQLVELSVASYPIFVIEDRGFEYGDLSFVRARLGALVPCGDEDHVHMNVYAIREDFVPVKPGVDSMGSLPHWHITDRALVPPRSEVFDEELARIARNA
ncbi:hypothetical protein AACH06_29820 [Ideonella sp. DXS29W]|uniref:Uncharacterized protein n=1 Tax=Ideonella lacteola TaxID=2984193 RepID=A0ABU9BYH3_9BURK